MGTGEPPVYPTPWAEDESLSALATESQARATMEQVGLGVDQWIGKVRESVAFFTAAIARTAEAGPPPIGIHLLMGANARDKMMNYSRNLTEGRVSVALGIASKK